MIRIIIGYIFILNILNADNSIIEKFIPKGYNYVQSMGDINNDKIEDIILNLQNFKEKKSRLIILKGLKSNSFSLLFDNNKSISYPIENGQGSMVRDISVNVLDNYLVIVTSEYHGTNINRNFFFQFINNKFYLEKYIESIGSKCNNYTISKEFIASDIGKTLQLKDFSLEVFFKKTYSSKEFQKKLKRNILSSFIPSYNKLLKAFRLNNKNILKKEINNILVYNDNDKLCKKYSYLDKYLYLNNTKTLGKSNDIAFFFEQAGYYKEAIYLLEEILKKYPNRTVAHYNLADAYWVLGEKKKAIASYTTYIEQMCDAGKEKRIPQVVKDRVSSK